MIIKINYSNERFIFTKKLKMKSKLLLLSLLLTSLFSFAQIDSTKVQFVAYWSIGDSYDFKVTKVKQQWKAGKQTKDEENSYTVNFKVVDSTATSYTIDWTFQNELLDNYKLPEKIAEKIEEYRFLKVQYKTSEVGDFLEIINWKEIGQKMNKMFDLIINADSKTDKKKKEEIKVNMQQFKEMYSSKEGVEQLILKEIQYFHMPLGREYETAEPVYYEEDIPNIFGGDPIKANGKLYFEAIDYEENFCILKNEMTLDPEDTKKTLTAVFKKMNLNDKEMSKALETAVFKIEDNNTYEYYNIPGIPHRIEAIRELYIDINQEKGKRIDKTIIELIYEE